MSMPDNSDMFFPESVGFASGISHVYGDLMKPPVRA